MDQNGDRTAARYKEGVHESTLCGLEIIDGNCAKACPNPGVTLVLPLDAVVGALDAGEGDGIGLLGRRINAS